MFDTLEVHARAQERAGDRMSAKIKKVFSEEDQANARFLMLALDPLYQDGPNISFHQLMAFLRVVADEGKSVNEYAADAALPSSSMTRNLLEIGDRARNGEPGRQWITQIRDLGDLRRLLAQGTPKGKALMSRINNAIKARRVVE
ncbi:hypothetical protein [Bradyrhizobium sp. BR 10289]|uniref:hypothetical protein n=1 Tax=Bradyrhizobium sp. BR 10289 TaxID=2749993 RepID=UPI001C649EFA|nr:hypothetical protein [Bradyrhizobium sp. BR 10289]MBW7970937.1 hypothetical protein [Bradyrhizobium sp. BR 10289]